MTPALDNLLDRQIDKISGYGKVWISQGGQRVFIDIPTRTAIVSVNRQDWFTSPIDLPRNWVPTEKPNSPHAD